MKSEDYLLRMLNLVQDLDLIFLVRHHSVVLYIIQIEHHSTGIKRIHVVDNMSIFLQEVIWHLPILYRALEFRIKL